jgi:hypothetical protein
MQLKENEFPRSLVLPKNTSDIHDMSNKPSNTSNPKDSVEINFGSK